MADWDVKPEDWGLPDEETMSCQDGLVENHDYGDMRGMTVEDYQEWCRWEDAVLAWGGDPFSDEALERFEEFGLIGALDPGVASAVVALSVIGACPVTCCSAAHERAYEKHPLVYAWIPAELEPMIRTAAEAAGVNVSGNPAGYSPGILIWTGKELAPMRAFADKLVEQWGK